MSAYLRKALFWLLVLALPMQTSMAAGAMGIAPASGAQAQMQAMQGLHASGPTAMGDESSAHRDCAGVGHGSDCHPTDGKCVLGASCLPVAALVQQMLVFVPMTLDSAPPSAMLQLRVTFFTDGPERPSRTFA